MNSTPSKRKEPPINDDPCISMNVGTLPTQKFLPENTIAACHCSVTAL